MSNPYAVQVGQVWRSMDPRDYPRRVKVLKIVGDKAVVQNVAGRNMYRQSKVRLDRFKATANGWVVYEGEKA